MLFLDGVAKGLMWTLRNAGTVQEIHQTSVVEEVERRGLTLTNESLRTAAADHFSNAAMEIQRQVEVALQEIESNSSLPPQIRPALEQALHEITRDGLPEATAVGRLFAHIQAALFDLLQESMPALDVSAEEAVPAIQRRLEELGMSFETQLERAGTGQDLDAFGPDILGRLGFCRDSRKAMKRRSPGPLADAVHSSYAMRSTLFVTSDRRLAQRLRAWAHYRSRGESHRQWPLIRTCRPDSPFEVEDTARTIAALARVFAGAVDEWLARQD